MFLDKIATVLRQLRPTRESGQTLVEYSLVIGLIAIAAIAGVGLVADQVGSLWGGIGDKVGEAVSNVLGL